MISIHALRKEGDTACITAVPTVSLFLSTPSARKATASKGGTPLVVAKFLSTPSARRATGQDHRRSLYPDISIHALRKEGDISSAR